MGSADPASAPERLRTTLRAGVTALVALAPLPFGGVGAGAVWLLQSGAVILAAIALVVVRSDPEGGSPRARPMWAPVAVLLGVGFVQWIPVGAGSGPAAALRLRVAEALPEIAIARAPHSLDPTATLDACLRLGAWVLIGFAASVAVRRRAHLAQMALGIAGAASFQAVYGIAEYLSGHQHVLGYAKQAYTDSATGTFINRNHFASYLAMALPLALGLAVGADRAGRPAPPAWRERLLWLGRPDGLRAAFGALAAVAIWSGIVLSYSRSGMAAGLLGALVVALRVPGRRVRAGLAVGLLALPTVWLLGQEVRAPGERFFAANPELRSLAGRVPVWRASMAMVRDHPLLGTGLGTFEGAFELYRPAEVRKSWAHAHNDWLQAWTEGGPLVLAAALALLVLALTRRGLDDARRLALVPVTAGVVAIAAHSAIDFSLRIPANAALCACLIGLTCIRARRVDPSVAKWPVRKRGERG